MPSVSCTDEQKGRFSDLRDQADEDFDTQGDFLEHLLDTYQAFDGELIDHAELAEEQSVRLVSQIELAVYRSMVDYFESNEISVNLK